MTKSPLHRLTPDHCHHSKSLPPHPHLTSNTKFTFSLLSSILTGNCLSASLSAMPASLYSHVSLPYTSADTKIQFSKLKLIYLLLIGLSLICCPRDLTVYPHVQLSLAFLHSYFYAYMGSIYTFHYFVNLTKSLHYLLSNCTRVLIYQ